jgi:hypothetical protein
MAVASTVAGVVLVAGAMLAGPAAIAQTAGGQGETAQAGASSVESVTPESLGIYRSTVSDPLDRRYREGRDVRVFDRDVMLSVQPPSAARRDYQGNERVRISR